MSLNSVVNLIQHVLRFFLSFFIEIQGRIEEQRKSVHN